MANIYDFSLVLNQALTIGAHLSPNTSNELVKFMLPLCLRHSLQVNVTPSVSPPSSMSLSFALLPPTFFRLNLELYTQIYRRELLVII